MPTAASEEDDEMVYHWACVPRGVSEGEEMVVRMRPSGAKLVVIVPAGCVPGKRFKFGVPRVRTSNAVSDAPGDVVKRKRDENNDNENRTPVDAKRAKLASLLKSIAHSHGKDPAAYDLAAFFHSLRAQNATRSAADLAWHLQEMTAPNRPR